jgi:hypothetical protein
MTLQYDYAIAPNNEPDKSNPWLVVMAHTSGKIETACKCPDRPLAEKRARRFNAIRHYAKLSGEQRYSLMIMLSVEHENSATAYDVCLDYIMEKCDLHSVRCLQG